MNIENKLYIFLLMLVFVLLSRFVTMMGFLFFRFLGLLVGTFVQLIPNEENNSHNSKNCIEAGALGKWNERLLLYLDKFHRKNESRFG